MVSIELDRARRKFHEAQNDLKNCRAFIARWDGDEDKAKSLHIERAKLPVLEARFAEAQATLKTLEEHHTSPARAADTRSFVLRERTTPPSAEEIAAIPDIPEFLRRVA